MLFVRILLVLSTMLLVGCYTKMTGNQCLAGKKLTTADLYAPCDSEGWSRGRGKIVYHRPACFGGGLNQYCIKSAEAYFITVRAGEPDGMPDANSYGWGDGACKVYFDNNSYFEGECKRLNRLSDGKIIHADRSYYDIRNGNINGALITDNVIIEKEEPIEEEKIQSSIEEAKASCKDIGFKEGTEKFGECVLQLTK